MVIQVKKTQAYTTSTPNWAVSFNGIIATIIMPSGKTGGLNLKRLIGFDLCLY
jgi:hypothetical protein